MDKQVEQKFRKLEKQFADLESRFFDSKKEQKKTHNELNELRRKTGDSLKKHAVSINKQNEAGTEVIKFLEFQNKRINRLNSSVILLVIWNIILTFVLILS